MKILRVFALAAYFVPIIVSASNWQLVTSADLASVSIDMQSLKINGTEREVWVKYVFRKPHKVPGSKLLYTFSVSYDVFDCVDNSYGERQDIYYDKSGVVVSDSGYVANVDVTNPIVPDSFADSVIVKVCALTAKTENPSPP